MSIIKSAGSARVSQEEPIGWPDDAERNRLIGDWHIYQRTGGHRTSTDDLITAWYAVHRNPGQPRRYLDLGCGVGSVLLMVSHRLRPIATYGIEAQAQSVAMARRTIEELPEHECVINIEESDFRHVDFAGESYPLITGSPPYFPVRAGVLPDDAQRRACRFEMRGGVEDYLETAARAMADEGRFYIVFQTLWEERMTMAATGHGLHPTGRADFQMRTDKPQPFLTVFEFARKRVATPHRFQCSVRDENGEITPQYQKLRCELGVGSLRERCGG